MFLIYLGNIFMFMLDMFCTQLLSVCDLPIHFFNAIFDEQIFLNFNEILWLLVSGSKIPLPSK